METYAYFRFPEQSKATLIAQNNGPVATLRSASELDGRSGFVFAPFAPSANNPIILIRPDTCKSISINSQPPASGKTTISPLTSRENELGAYTADFNRFHHQIENGNLSKIVLARVSTLVSSAKVSPYTLFCRACNMYPHLFVALVSTPQTGTWIVATPELLLSATEKECETMALAGTMKAADYKNGSGWTEKEYQEQKFVSLYINSVISQIADNITENGPETITAADLVHLRTKFSFTIKDGNNVSDALAALHPTPAVCGLPKNNAMDFILKSEHSPRKYYSGFLGPWAVKQSTSLYVSLRCMHINDRIFDLYAGGGLLKQSTLSKEWEETEAKLNTMKNILYV